MVKYVTPLLILVVEIFGVKDLLFPGGVFNVNGLGVVLTAYGLLFVAIAIYFIFFKNRDTGCNADEIDIAMAASLDVDDEEDLQEIAQ